jgi:DNA (cytosine-5)-methyltransferase 1
MTLLANAPLPSKPSLTRTLLGDAAAVPTSNVRKWAHELGVRAALGIRTTSLHGGCRAAGPIDVVDLFCGCGGLSVGFEYVGRLCESYRLAGAIDIDENCARTYAANLGVTPLMSDLAEATRYRTGIEDLVKRFDLRDASVRVLLGGPPCQGFSAHKKKVGHGDDERNRLVVAFARFVRALAPDVVLFENVPELFAKNFWHHFVQVRTMLESCGYAVTAHIHNLAGYGVPQERFRAIVMAMRKPFGVPDHFLATEDYVTVRNAIGHLPPVKPGGPSPADPMHYCTRHRRSTIQTIRRVPRDGGCRPPGVGPKCLDRVDGFRDVYGRMYWDRPSNTITGSARNPASGRYVHPEQHRGLTIREVALLQTFPPGFVFEGSFDSRFMQIGNAVPPAFAAYAAAHILGELAASTPPTTAAASGSVTIHEPTSNSFSSGIAGRKRCTTARKHA